MAQERRATGEILDAMTCGVSGFDFFERKCLKPDNQSGVEREGWIWVWGPDNDSSEISGNSDPLLPVARSPGVEGHGKSASAILADMRG